MLLTIVGPNLIDQSTGSFHVHSAGCEDLKRGQYRLLGSGDSHFMTGHYESARDVVEDVFGDIIAEGDSTWESCEGEFHFFPCCSELPAE
jgi:hypothetical protein